MKLIISAFIITVLTNQVISDCQKMADSGYCTNPLYQKIMCQNCKKQCEKYCVIPVPDPSCTDHASNCSTMAALCNSPTYKPLMEKECPSTCRFCSGGSTTTSSFSSTTTQLSSTTTTSSSTTTTTTIKS
uniref:ShKT domain-containing protein n=1 Tax=Parastrongyloides trichosuri TaxID=131310 RepID=A0A0N4ZRA9_PARTI